MASSLVIAPTISANRLNLGWDALHDQLHISLNEYQSLYVGPFLRIDRLGDALSVYDFR